jgi:hypothetical protein
MTSPAPAFDPGRVEARAGCHCATLAHHALRLSPPRLGSPANPDLTAGLTVNVDGCRSGCKPSGVA